MIKIKALKNKEIKIKAIKIKVIKIKTIEIQLIKMIIRMIKVNLCYQDQNGQKEKSLQMYLPIQLG